MVDDYWRPSSNGHYFLLKKIHNKLMHKNKRIRSIQILNDPDSEREPPFDLCNKASEFRPFLDSCKL